jgi:signal transduction histidine kinase
VGSSPVILQPHGVTNRPIRDGLSRDFNPLIHFFQSVIAMDKSFTEHMPRDGHDREALLHRLARSEKMAELGRLSAGIIHEVNTPLSVIAAASQMVLCERDLPEIVVELVERIYQEAQRLSQLTRGILSFSREEDGPDRETDVNLIIREVLTFLKYEMLKRSITVIENLDPCLPLMHAQPNVLKQVFLNLIVNALQAIGTDGQLFLATSRTNDGMLRVAVRDTGPGIADAMLEKIFTPFFTTKDAGEGTGLGLFVTKNNVEQLGGRIAVASVLGQGTCFTLSFPAMIS